MKSLKYQFCTVSHWGTSSMFKVPQWETVQTCVFCHCKDNKIKINLYICSG